MDEKVILTWSGGKDSSMSLHEIMQKPDMEISSLLTTVTGEYNRISMHGVRRELLEHQAESIGFPLETLIITKNATNDEYESRMKDILLKHKKHGVRTVVFGDIFLDDLRKYREDKLANIGMNAIFPLWKKDTFKLARRFIDNGFKSVISCVDTEVLDRGFSGRDFDASFLADLPDNIDPCGENGEFHTFVFDGPIFKRPISIKKGKRILRDGRFCFCDILPLNSSEQ